MECQGKDSKKVFKEFDATKSKRTKKKHEALEDWQSVASEGSNDRRRGTTSRHVSSTKGSLHELARSPNGNIADVLHGKGAKERHSDQSVHNPHQGETGRRSSSRRHRRVPREEVSLALRAGLVSTPRSISPQNCEGLSAAPHDENSFMEGLLEEAIKQERRKHRHSRRHEDHVRRDHRESSPREHRHRRHKDEVSKSKKEEKSSIDQAILLETFLKLCSQMHTNPGRITRTHSNKSLQCEASRHPPCDRGRSREPSQHTMSPNRKESNVNCHSRNQMPDRTTILDDRIQTVYDPREKNRPRYASRLNMSSDLDERIGGYSLKVSPTRRQIDLPVHDRSYESDRKCRTYGEGRRMIGQRMSRSFNDTEICEDGTYRKAGRSGVKNRSFDSGAYRDQIYEDRRYKHMDYDPNNYHRDWEKQNRVYRSQNVDLDRASVFSPDGFHNRGKYMERERDVLSADEETSTVSCKSNYLRAVKQEITEQREAMDKMMMLWKELMRAFKGPSPSREPTNADAETTAHVRESAATQLRLWRECMRRYETVARDVGDTDARLMEEMNKQRSEMSEMMSVFQECLQRYKVMSNDFNTLKQQLQSESPIRQPGAQYPPPCTDGDPLPPPAHCRPPSAYPPTSPTEYGLLQHVAGIPSHMGVGGYPVLRPQLSAPPPGPPCCWAGRGSSPDYRDHRDHRDQHNHRDHRHSTRDRDRGESRCKEKRKPGGTRSEHRHRKR